MPEKEWIVPALRRTVDVVAAAAGLLFALPVLLLAAVGNAVSSPGPVLFHQIRVGRRGRTFTLHKFRSMTAGSEGPPLTAFGDARLTAVGTFLRKFKLDELPQLWNVLRGDMSLVGPRPEVPCLVDPGDSRWQEVLAVRPGLTDPVTLALRDEGRLLARVPGDREKFYRTNLQPLKLHRYIAYLRRRTLWGDIKVLFDTAAAVAAPRRYNPRHADSEVLIRKDRIDFGSPL
jgi:lipopolysaccharide/colanic/teichoic acid biosynthesis glycosyltransferase